jgi:hypothetical protein
MVGSGASLWVWGDFSCLCMGKNRIGLMGQVGGLYVSGQVLGASFQYCISHLVIEKIEIGNQLYNQL